MKTQNINTQPVALTDFGCYVLIRDGVLFCTPMLENGSMETAAWNEVTAPSGHMFLNAVNVACGTNYCIMDFDGR